eukprot:gene33505-biopygen21688
MTFRAPARDLAFALKTIGHSDLLARAYPDLDEATVHFSIGSGTKLAMEDAIALYESMGRAATVEEGLNDYEHGRREETEKIQHSADVSLVWFEHVDRFWDFDPVQFAFGVMTRSKAITYDNLTLRAPDFVKEVDLAFARQVQAQGFDVDLQKPSARLPSTMAGRSSRQAGWSLAARISRPALASALSINHHQKSSSSVENRSWVPA